jgi:hypothetical protein
MSQVLIATLKADAKPSVVIDLQEEFQRSPYWPVRQLICRAREGRVVLQGTVPCYYLKQVAQTVALKTVGTGSLCSEIEVRPE